MTTNRLTAMPLLLLSLSLLACSGSPTGPTKPQAGIEFNPTSGSTPPVNSISMQEASITSTQLTLRIEATGVNNLSGIFFDVVFNPNIIMFVKPASEGSFLATSGSSTTFTAEFDMTSGENPGRLVVSNAILGDASTSGDGTIATLVFSRLSEGTSGLSFEAFGALRPDGQAVPGLAFFGGSVTVR